MKHLARAWSRIKKDISGKAVYLFLDFDGTITPIRRRPGDVKLSKGTRKLLEKLVSQENISVAMISGRELKELKRLVKVKGIVYAGNHGLEAEGPGFKFTAPKVLKAKKVIGGLKEKLKKELRPFKGTLVEDKKLTLSVHFRMADLSRLGEIKRRFRKITAPHLSHGQIVITTGKMVWEVRPPIRWGKGEIVSELLEKEKKKIKKDIMPFYIGDDRTDEDAFRALGRKAYTVKVGKPTDRLSSARYYLRGVEEVRELLKKVLSFKEGETNV